MVHVDVQIFLFASEPSNPQVNPGIQLIQIQHPRIWLNTCIYTVKMHNMHSQYRALPEFASHK